jgi:hypothetical protein
MRSAHPQEARGVDFAISSRSGQQVVEMPTYPLQLTCLGVIYGTPALAAVFVALRIYTRRKLNLRLSWGMYFTAACATDANNTRRRLAYYYPITVINSSYWSFT